MVPIHITIGDEKYKCIIEQVCAVFLGSTNVTKETTRDQSCHLKCVKIIRFSIWIYEILFKNDNKKLP